MESIVKKLLAAIILIASTQLFSTYQYQITEAEQTCAKKAEGYDRTKDCYKYWYSSIIEKAKKATTQKEAIALWKNAAYLAKQQLSNRSMSWKVKRNTLEYIQRMIKRYSKHWENPANRKSFFEKVGDDFKHIF